MSNFQYGSYTDSPSYTANRSILKNVYLWMTAALVLTGVVAWVVSGNQEFVYQLFQGGMVWGLFIGQIALVFILSGLIHKLSPMVATLCFAAYSILMGVNLSIVFLAYDLGTIYAAFFISAGTFAAMSVYALTTKRDLTSWGNFLFMGLIGLVIASVVNFFLKSGPLGWLVSMAGVLIFTGLTAYDTWRIKQMSEKLGSNINEADFIKLSIRGALSLYLDFINIFLQMLRLFSRR